MNQNVVDMLEHIKQAMRSFGAVADDVRGGVDELIQMLDDAEDNDEG